MKTRQIVYEFNKQQTQGYTMSLSPQYRVGRHKTPQPRAQHRQSLYNLALTVAACRIAISVLCLLGSHRNNAGEELFVRGRVLDLIFSIGVSKELLVRARQNKAIASGNHDGLMALEERRDVMDSWNFSAGVSAVLLVISSILFVTATSGHSGARQSMLESAGIPLAGAFTAGALLSFSLAFRLTLKQEIAEQGLRM